jgi:hypothetical protein
MGSGDGLIKLIARISIDILTEILLNTESYLPGSDSSSV